MLKLIKIWFSVIKKYFDLKSISIFLIEFFAHILVVFLFTRNINLSLVFSVLLIVIRLSVKLFLFYKNLIQSNNYNLILLKPIDPLFGLLIYNHNPADILILLPILIYIKLRNYKK